MRFLGLGLADPVPDANTIWTFREALTRAEIDGEPAIAVLFRSFEAALAREGFLATGGQIVDATIVAAPKQRNTEGEKAEIRAGRIPQAWREKPAKLAQKDRDARWTVKFSKAKPSDDGSLRIDLAVPAFGYKNHITIDRKHGLIRTWTATHAARHDGVQLPNLVSNNNTASDVWADTAYRSKANEKHLADQRPALPDPSQEPPGRPMLVNVSRANAARSKIRAAVEHVFARQKGPMALVVRTIGITQASVKIGFANIAYNMRQADGSRSRMDSSSLGHSKADFLNVRKGSPLDQSSVEPPGSTEKEYKPNIQSMEVDMDNNERLTLTAAWLNIVGAGLVSTGALGQLIAVSLGDRAGQSTWGPIAVALALLVAGVGLHLVARSLVGRGESS